MAQILVRNLDEGVKQALKRRAQRHGRSMEEEARLILTRATEAKATSGSDASLGLGSRMAALFQGLELNEPIPTWHGEEANPAHFES
ncbi:MAG: hypothetical protein RLZZ515_1694 [Cyanobacteriota bacterium]|jgi:plasmid stability protein